MKGRSYFIDGELYSFRSRSIRIMGHSTSLRIENQYWKVLEMIAEKEETTLPELVSSIYLKANEDGLNYHNFTSLLRLYCLRYVEEECR